jgi:hypothetical protein
MIACRRVSQVSPSIALTSSSARSAVEVAMFRVYCSLPGASATMTRSTESA